MSIIPAECSHVLTETDFLNKLKEGDVLTFHIYSSEYTGIFKSTENSDITYITCNPTSDKSIENENGFVELSGDLKSLIIAKSGGKEYVRLNNDLFACLSYEKEDSK